MDSSIDTFVGNALMIFNFSFLDVVAAPQYKRVDLLVFNCCLQSTKEVKIKVCTLTFVGAYPNDDGVYQIALHGKDYKLIDMKPPTPSRHSGDFPIAAQQTRRNNQKMNNPSRKDGKRPRHNTPQSPLAHPLNRRARLDSFLISPPRPITTTDTEAYQSKDATTNTMLDLTSSDQDQKEALSSIAEMHADLVVRSARTYRVYSMVSEGLSELLVTMKDWSTGLRKGAKVNFKEGLQLMKLARSKLLKHPDEKKVLPEEEDHVRAMMYFRTSQAAAQSSDTLAEWMLFNYACQDN
ncbi:hypothetical protein MMC13_005649 [Lambiella insularis]|nr:hypothetical protein [Lambiella insularis]